MMSIMWGLLLATRRGKGAGVTCSPFIFSSSSPPPPPAPLSPFVVSRSHTYCAHLVAGDSRSAAWNNNPGGQAEKGQSGGREGHSSQHWEVTLLLYLWHGTEDG